MKADLFLQNNGANSLYDNLQLEFNNNPKKVIILIGKLKEDGFDLLEEQLIDCKSSVYLALGIDKKNTTKSILEGLLKYTDNIYIYNNNDINEFESNVAIFENNSVATIYVSTAAFSKNGVIDNKTVYTKVEYNLKDKEEKKEYNGKINDIVSCCFTESNNEQEDVNTFRKLTNDMIEELINNKSIFSTKQYIHNVKSISELLGKNVNNDNNSKIEKYKDNEYIKDIEIPKIDIKDDNLDISIDISDIEEDNNINEIEEVEPLEEIEDISKLDEVENLDKIKELYDNEFQDKTDVKENQNVDKSNKLYDESLENIGFNENETLDINELLFSKADAKLDLDDKENLSKVSKKKLNNNDEIIDKDEVIKIKKVNLNNVSNFIFEMYSKPKTGNGINSIKIPNYIRKMIPDFFELESVENTIEDGILYKKRNITLEIVDVKNNLKYNDNNASISYKNNQTFISFDSDFIGKIEYDMYDIVRVIKLSSNIYHIEFISKDIQEYKIWKKLCTQKLKSVDRMFGMM